MCTQHPLQLETAGHAPGYHLLENYISRPRYIRSSRTDQREPSISTTTSISCNDGGNGSVRQILSNQASLGRTLAGQERLVTSNRFPLSLYLSTRTAHAILSQILVVQGQQGPLLKLEIKFITQKGVDIQSYCDQCMASSRMLQMRSGQIHINSSLLAI